MKFFSLVRLQQNEDCEEHISELYDVWLIVSIEFNIAIVWDGKKKILPVLSEAFSCN